MSGLTESGRRTSFVYLHAGRTLTGLESRAAGDFTARGSVSCVQFSHGALDGSLLAAGSDNGELSLLDTRGPTPREPVSTTHLHRNMIVDVVLSFDDAMLVSAGFDGVCKCVDVATGRTTAVLNCASSVGPLRHVRFCDPRASCGPGVIIAAGRGPVAAIFDPRMSALPVARIPGPVQPASEAPATGDGSACESTDTPPLSGHLCLSCAPRRPGGPGEDRMGGITAVDHYLITGGAASGDVQIWDVRRYESRVGGRRRHATRLCVTFPLITGAPMPQAPKAWRHGNARRGECSVFRLPAHPRIYRKPPFAPTAPGGGGSRLCTCGPSGRQGQATAARAPSRPPAPHVTVERHGPRSSRAGP